MTTTTYKIPLSATAQQFRIELAGTTYLLKLTWNPNASVWNLDIYSDAEVAIVRGIPLVANINLLLPFAHLNFGGSLIAYTDHDPDSPPTYENLGSTGNLYFVVES